MEKAPSSPQALTHSQDVPTGSPEQFAALSSSPHDLLLAAKDLTIAYGDFTLMKEVSFLVNRGDIFIIMGGSGCGKSTLLRVLMGLKEPSNGNIYYGETDFWHSEEKERQQTMRRTGVLFQGGALWSSMTLAENVSLPLQQYTTLKPAEIREQASLKLALAGLAGFEDYLPSEISGGMRKRAGLARALALDPEILFLDEPSAGLDPLSARLLDDLILELQETLNKTFVIVTHELASIFNIGSKSLFLNATTRRAITAGRPADIVLDENADPAFRLFLRRGETTTGTHS